MNNKEQIMIDGVNVICENCGKQFKKKLYEYKRRKHHFCSPNCYHNFRIKSNEIIVYSDYAEIVIGDKAALIDIGDVDFCKKHNWRISNKGYVTTTINRKSKHLHRLIMSPMPQEEIDHINRDKLDNRKENLRICDRLTNMQNRGVNKNSSTGYNGIYFNKKGKFVPISWKQAFDVMEQQFRKAYEKDGPNAVGLMASGQYTIPEGYAALKLFKAGFRSNNIDPNARHCMASAVVGFMQTFGIDEPAGCYDDIELTDTIVTWGANMAEMHPILWTRITDRRLKNPDKVKIINLSTYTNRTSDIADIEIPDASERLRYIIQMTDKAATRTLDAVDACKPIAQEVINSIENLMPMWDRLMHGHIDRFEFVTLCHQIDEMLNTTRDNANTLSHQLNEILMAQDYQDLTGQMIQKVISLVTEIEDDLVKFLITFSEISGIKPKSRDERLAEKIEEERHELTGPALESQKESGVVVSNQDDVDDLLASLGF